LLHFFAGHGVLMKKLRMNSDLPQSGHATNKLPIPPTITQPNAKGKMTSRMVSELIPNALRVMGIAHMMTNIASITAVINLRPLT
jgi:hypothetical protein